MAKHGHQQVNQNNSGRHKAESKLSVEKMLEVFQQRTGAQYKGSTDPVIMALRMSKSIVNQKDRIDAIMELMKEESNSGPDEKKGAAPSAEQSPSPATGKDQAVLPTVEELVDSVLQPKMALLPEPEYSGDDEDEDGSDEDLPEEHELNKEDDGLDEEDEDEDEEEDDGLDEEDEDEDEDDGLDEEDEDEDEDDGLDEEDEDEDEDDGLDEEKSNSSLPETAALSMIHQTRQPKTNEVQVNEVAPVGVTGKKTNSPFALLLSEVAEAEEAARVEAAFKKDNIQQCRKRIQALADSMQESIESKALVFIREERSSIQNGAKKKTLVRRSRYVLLTGVPSVFFAGMCTGDLGNPKIALLGKVSKSGSRVVFYDPESLENQTEVSRIFGELTGSPEDSVRFSNEPNVKEFLQSVKFDNIVPDGSSDVYVDVSYDELMSGRYLLEDGNDQNDSDTSVDDTDSEDV